MCGIVGASSGRDVVPTLIEGLKRLEYRGYDSAGLAVLDAEGQMRRLRAVGKVRNLEDALVAAPIAGTLGIAHTRWATHGAPTERNAHPHVSRDGLAIVHNGIIENHEALRAELARAGYQFESETDTEVIAHRVHFHLARLGDLHQAVRATVAELEGAFAPMAAQLFERVQSVHIVACGTSFHAGIVARYFIEQLCRLPCRMEIASEYRYRSPVVQKNALLVAISQSGETADTLAALRLGRQLGYLGTLAICNVPESSLVREADLVMLARAGPEVGVASTKAFTTQLVALSLLAIALARHNGGDAERERSLVGQLIELPGMIEKTLELNDTVHQLALHFADKQHALFLGRGPLHAIALEGALKLKEISYIHAEGYAAGELKHGPLALVDAGMPVVTVAPNNELLEKLKSNLMEVRARGGELYVFADPDSGFTSSDGVHVIVMPRHVSSFQAPVIYTIPLQLLAYHVAILRGTDVDHPRNLAKSVTVE